MCMTCPAFSSLVSVPLHISSSLRNSQHQALLRREDRLLIAAKLAEEIAGQVHGAHLHVIRLHQDRELQSALAPRVLRVVGSYLAQVKALDELYKLGTKEYALIP